MTYARLRRWWFSTALLPLLCCAAGGARADVVDISGGLWQDFVLVHPTSLAVTDYFAITAGTVTFSLQDQHSRTPEWGQTLSTLSGTITTAAGDRLLLQGGGASARMFEIGANERFSTSIFSTVAGTAYGAYVVDVRFTPYVSTVPLPPSALLLLAGIGLLATRVRRRAAARASGG